MIIFAFMMPNNSKILRNQQEYKMKKPIKIRTDKSDKAINPNDVSEIMQILLESYGKGEKTYDYIKAAYKFVNPNSLFVSGFLLPLLTKFTYGGNDHFEQHRADVIRKMTHIYYTVISVEPQGKFKGTSYDHQKVQRTLLDTETDDNKKRSQLRASCGFNQKVVCFFQPKSFITFNDLHQLTDCQAEIEKANNYRETFTKNKSNSYSKNRNNNFPTNRKKVNCYSLINCITTKLTINNDSKAYIGYIKVHLMSLKNYRNCEGNMGTLTIDELINYYVNEIDSPSDKSINSWELLKVIDKNSKNNEFMSRLLVAPYTNVLNSQCIQDHIDVLNTYCFELKPSETAIITVVNNLTKGINLFDLHKHTSMEESENKLNAPAGTFFMLEAVGSSNAEVIEINDRENRYNGTAPIKLRISEKIVMDCQTERHKATDTPAAYTFIDENKEFLDEEFAEVFSPAKSAKINFDIEEIDLDGTNPKGKKYILAQDSLSLMTTAESVRTALKDPSLDFRDAMHLNKLRKDSENFEDSDYNENENKNQSNDETI